MSVVQLAELVISTSGIIRAEHALDNKPYPSNPLANWNRPSFTRCSALTLQKYSTGGDGMTVTQDSLDFLCWIVRLRIIISKFHPGSSTTNRRLLNHPTLGNLKYGSIMITPQRCIWNGLYWSRCQGLAELFRRFMINCPFHSVRQFVRSL